MKTDIWMPIYIGDYLKDTRHLNTEDHGAYLLIMMELWNRKGKMKRALLPVISLQKDDVFFNKIWPKIEEFFIIDKDGFISQKRLTKEFKASQKRRKAAKDNGKLGGRPRKLKETQGKPIGFDQVNPIKTSSSSPSPSQKNNSSKGRTNAPLFEDYKPSDTMKEWCKKHGITERGTFDNYVESCLDWFRSEGKKKLDWEATIKGWIRRDREKKGMWR